MSSTFNVDELAQFTNSQEALDYVESMGYTTDEVVIAMKRRGEQVMLELSNEIENIRDDDELSEAEKVDIISDLEEEVENVRRSDAVLNEAETMPSGLGQMNQVFHALEVSAGMHKQTTLKQKLAELNPF